MTAQRTRFELCVAGKCHTGAGHSIIPMRFKIRLNCAVEHERQRVRQMCNSRAQHALDVLKQISNMELRARITCKPRCNKPTQFTSIKASCSRLRLLVEWAKALPLRVVYLHIQLAHHQSTRNAYKTIPPTRHGQSTPHERLTASNQLRYGIQACTARIEALEFQPCEYAVVLAD